MGVAAQQQRNPSASGKKVNTPASQEAVDMLAIKIERLSKEVGFIQSGIEKTNGVLAEQRVTFSEGHGGVQALQEALETAIKTIQEDKKKSRWLKLQERSAFWRWVGILCVVLVLGLGAISLISLAALHIPVLTSLLS